MSKSKYSSENLFSYLLRTMDSAEREDLERHMFEDDNLVLELFEAEDELMEMYTAGSLNAETKGCFEKIYGQNGPGNIALHLYRMLSKKNV